MTLDLYTYVMQHYTLHISSQFKEMIQEHNISMLDSPQLATAIYRLQHQYLSTGQTASEEAPIDKNQELAILTIIQKQFCGCEIYYSSEIGENFLLVHGLGTMIGSRANIGNNCTVYQNVTIGAKKMYATERPTIGNNVVIYTGAKIFGDIKIGDGAVIGANAIVTKDVKPNITIVSPLSYALPLEKKV